MLCPSCGNDVPESKFCENCGAPMSTVAPAAETAPVDADGVVDAAADTANQTFDPYGLNADASSDVSDVTQQTPAFQVDPTVQMSQDQAYGGAQQQPDLQGFDAPAANQQPFGAQPYDAQQPYGAQPGQPGAQPYAAAQPVSPGMATAAAAVAPSTAFVLAIVGLICGVLGITFLIGLILCIVALVLNSKYTKQGLSNPRQTSTKVISIIGIVISAIALICTILFAALFAQVWAVLEENDFDVDRIEIVEDGKGGIIVREKSTSTGTGTSTGSSGTSTSTGSSSAASTSTGSAAPSTVAYDDKRCYDSHSNPTLFAIFELDGKKMTEFLDDADFTWDSSQNWYTAPDGSYFYVDTLHGDDLTNTQIAALAKGGQGTPVEWTYGAYGYSSCEDALQALTGDVKVEKTEVYKEIVDALVYDAQMRPYLVEFIKDDTADNVILVRIFNEEAVTQGWFAETMKATDAKTVDQAWEAWKP